MFCILLRVTLHITNDNNVIDKQRDRPVVNGRTVGLTQDARQRSLEQQILLGGQSESLTQYDEVHGRLDGTPSSGGQTPRVSASAANLSLTSRRNSQLSRQLSSTYTPNITVNICKKNLTV